MMAVSCISLITGPTSELSHQSVARNPVSFSEFWLKTVNSEYLKLFDGDLVQGASHNKKTWRYTMCLQHSESGTLDHLERHHRDNY